MANGFRCEHCGRQEATHLSGNYDDCPNGYKPTDEELEWEKEMSKIPVYKRKRIGIKIYHT